MTGVLVKKNIKTEGLIEVPEDLVEERCFKPASYDLRLGSEYFYPKRDTHGIDIASHHDIGDCTDGILRVPPYSSIIISSLEKVRLPQYVVGRFDLRVKWALRGLIFQNGTQVEPGYYGGLYGLVLNLSDTERSIRYGDYKDRIFTIEFRYTTEPGNVKASTADPSLKDFLESPVIVGGLDKFIETSKVVTEKAKEASDAALRSRAGRWELWASGILLLITLAISIVLPITITRAIEDRVEMFEQQGGLYESDIQRGLSSAEQRQIYIIDKIASYNALRDMLNEDSDEARFLDERINKLINELDK